jgi:hypothetical protein
LLPGASYILDAGGFRQRQRGHQSFQEATLLSRPAVMSPENKGGLYYIPFRAGYRNGGRVQLVPYIVTCYYTGCFNLWGEATLLWSCTRYHSPTLFFLCFSVALIISLPPPCLPNTSSHQVLHPQWSAPAAGHC